MQKRKSYAETEKRTLQPTVAGIDSCAWSTAALRVERRGTPLRVTLGVLSLCFGVLLGTLLILITTDILSAAFLVTPFLLGGVIALAVQKHTLLWCGWVLCGYFGLTARWMVGMNVSAPMLLIMIFVLCPCTVLASQNRKK